MSCLKIAIADSSDYYRNMISNTLEEKKFNIVGTAETSEEMGEIINSNFANLFFIDILIPDSGGVKLAHSIADKKQELFIVMMSSLEDYEFLSEAMKIGIIDYLKKPFGRLELLKTIYKAEERVGNA